MNKTLLITGGSRGIGRAAAAVFAENGTNVFFTYKQHDADAADSLINIISAYRSWSLKVFTHYIMRSLTQKKAVDNMGFVKLWKTFDEALQEKISQISSSKPALISRLQTEHFLDINLFDETQLLNRNIYPIFTDLSTGGFAELKDLITLKCCIFKGCNENEQFVEKLVDKLISSVGKIDFLVNNAAISSHEMIQDIDFELLNQEMAINFVSAVNTVKHAAPYMISEKQGSIINIASMWGIRGASTESLYSATKGALIAFTKSAAKELGPSGIRVNAVAPGVVMTDMMKGYSNDNIKELAERASLCRVSEPDSIARLIYFLAEETGCDFNGAVLTPDNGFIG